MMVQERARAARVAPAPDIAEIERWAQRLQGLVERIGRHFARAEARGRVLAYLQAWHRAGQAHEHKEDQETASTADHGATPP